MIVDVIGKILSYGPWRLPRVPSEPDTTCLPTFDECDTAIRAGRPTALEVFIFDHEPAVPADARRWRRQLDAVLAEAGVWCITTRRIVDG